MTCRECGMPTAVVDTRMAGERIRRRRVCDNGHRFTTYELFAADHDAIDAAAEDVRAAVARLLAAVEVETPVFAQVKKYRGRAA